VFLVVVFGVSFRFSGRFCVLWTGPFGLEGKTERIPTPNVSGRTRNSSTKGNHIGTLLGARIALDVGRSFTE